MKHVLLVVTSLLLTYVLAFITLMIRWMNFWIRGSYFVSYQAIVLITLTIFLLWWLRRHHTGPLPVSSTILYSLVVGYVSGLIAMTLYPITQPDGLQQVAMGLRFPTPGAVAAFLWFPVRMLAWLFGGIAGMVILAMSRRIKLLSLE
ncbi:MAG: hypothetical protein CV088_01350 [Nitrospira sp. LK70]|nr:hypothetical protein [Nitrospira sp. LK70]